MKCTEATSRIMYINHQISVKKVRKLTATVAKVSTSDSVCIHDPTYICSVIWGNQ